MCREDIDRAIGLADSCELAAAVFAFPDERLAEGLSSGAVAADAACCLREAGAEADVVGMVADELVEFEGGDARNLFGVLRKGHSLLYLAPGIEVPVWPYESAFLLRRKEPGAVPSLFRSACALDVERLMREAGALPDTARTEPCDSVWDELSFMSFLYGSMSAALSSGLEADALVWRRRIDAFWKSHMSLWLPAFMEDTARIASTLSHGAEYARLAGLGFAVLSCVAADVERTEA